MELDRMAAMLETAGAGEAERYSARVSPRWIVEAGDERAVVDMRWLVQALRNAPAVEDWPAERERLRRRLVLLRMHALEASAADSPAAVHSTLRASVEDALMRPEFNRVGGPTWLELVQQRVLEWLENVLRGLGVANVDGRRAAIGLAWIVGLTALAGLGLWSARMLTRAPVVLSQRFEHGRREVLSAEEWGRRAMAALREGDAREAVRCAYNGALRRLNEEGVWRVDRARTPREYLRLLEPGDERREPVAYLAELFERVWYGNHVVAAGEDARVGASLERLGCLGVGERRM